MSQNQIEGAKENINFLSRTMLAYIAGVYLLAGSVSNWRLGLRGILGLSSPPSPPCAWAF